MSAPTATTGASRLPDVRIGLVRGWISFRSLVTSREGIAQYTLWTAVPIAVLVLNRGSTVPGTGIPVTAALLPALLAVMLAFGVMGTAHPLATEREDGTLLRLKAVPGGMSNYVVGLSVASVLDGLLSLSLLMLPAVVLVPGVPLGSAGFWLGLLGYVLLGLAAVVPLGILIGSVVASPRLIGGLGMLATTGLAAVSGLFFPLQALWGWVQVLAQVFPLYWLGIGMRSVFLSPEAAALEIGGSWRTLETIGVLGAWAAVGLLLGPVLLRRTARRESGSAVETRRQRALQRA